MKRATDTRDMTAAPSWPCAQIKRSKYAGAPPPSVMLGLPSKDSKFAVYGTCLPTHDFLFHFTGEYDEAVLEDHLKRWRNEDGTPKADLSTAPALRAALQQEVRRLQPVLASVPITMDFVEGEVEHQGGLFKVYLWRKVLYTALLRQQQLVQTQAQTQTQTQTQPPQEGSL